jgi:predicted membrane protein
MTQKTWNGWLILCGIWFLVMTATFAHEHKMTSLEKWIFIIWAVNTCICFYVGFSRIKNQ